MTSEKSLTDEQLQGAAVRFILAMMYSASTERINPINWWVRAQSALETAATMSESLPQMASRMAKKLQIDAPLGRTSRDVSLICSELGDDFERFRQMCERESFFVIALARVERDRQVAERKAREAAEKEAKKGKNQNEGLL